MIIIVVWIVAALLCALPAQKKPIGLGMCFVWGLLLSPLVGLIIALASKDYPPESPKLSYNDEMLKLVTLKEKNIITEEEFLKSKEKLDIEKNKPVVMNIKTLNEMKAKGEISQEDYLIKIKTLK